MRSRISTFTAAMSGGHGSASRSWGFARASSRLMSVLVLRLDKPGGAPYFGSMRELLRTNDPTVIAFATAILEGEGIDVFQIGRPHEHPRRLRRRIAAAAHGAGPRPLPRRRDPARSRHRASGLRMAFAPEELTTDAFLGGRLAIRQPKAGLPGGDRSGAAGRRRAGAGGGGGAGTWAAGRGWRRSASRRGWRGSRSPGSRCSRTMRRWRGENAAANGIALEVVEGDLARLPAELAGAELRPCHREPALLPARGRDAGPRRGARDRVRRGDAACRVDRRRDAPAPPRRALHADPAGGPGCRTSSPRSAGGGRRSRSCPSRRAGAGGDARDPCSREGRSRAVPASPAADPARRPGASAGWQGLCAPRSGCAQGCRTPPGLAALTVRKRFVLTVV